MKGLEIKMLRLSKRVKQLEMSKQLGINKTYISLIETDSMEAKGYSEDFIGDIKQSITKYLKTL